MGKFGSLREKLASPAQKICEGHHACLGGKAACEGNGESKATEGLGVAVATGSVVVVDWAETLENVNNSGQSVLVAQNDFIRGIPSERLKTD